MPRRAGFALARNCGFLSLPHRMLGVMSGLRSVIDELAAEDPRTVATAQLGEDIGELVRARNRLDAQLAHRVRAFEQRRGHVDDGAVSMASWLRWKCGLSGGAARRQVKVSRDLPHMPATTTAFEEGDLDLTRVDMLVSARGVDPGVFAATEDALVDAAREQSHRDLRKVIAYWRQAADGPRELEREQKLHQRRRLHLSQTLDGMFRLDAELDPESGEVVRTALAALAEPAAKNRADDRTPSQRRADALVELCGFALDHKDLPQRGGRRPHLTVLVSLETLEGRLGHTAELGDTVITPRTALRLACDANITRIITKGKSQPLEVGRSTRTIPAAIRTAVEVRDRHCRAVGCDRPPAWCDVHHLDHWANGGETKLDRLALLCRIHHIMEHLGLIRLRPP